MTSTSLRILQVSTSDHGGGAEKVARELAESLLGQGHQCWLAVGRRNGLNRYTLEISDEFGRSSWARLMHAVADVFSPLAGRVPGPGRLQVWLRQIGEPKRWWDARRGLEDFDFPGSRRLLQLPPQRPQIVHLHNLHGGYFDLRYLPELSNSIPTVLTPHDAWLVSGHCAHSLECERWTTGCGSCPDLSLYPAVRADRTAFNWRRKRRIYLNSRLFVTPPCRWLMTKLEKSIFASAIAKSRIIHYGVRRDVFGPADRREARAELGLPQGVRILLFAANGIRNNVWKDYRSLRTAIARLGERPGNRVLFVALGERALPEVVGRAEIRFVEFQQDPRITARYFQAADLYLHAALADTFPNSVLEALCCGLPVVATAVGGIPEQVRSYDGFAATSATKSPTGALVPARDPDALSAAIQRLLNDDNLRTLLARNAAEDAAVRFDHVRQTGEMVRWYREILDGMAA